jgi:hypothetical protein
VGVAQNREQPGARVPAVEPFDPAVCAEQRVLDQIHCLRVIPREGMRDSEQDLDLGRDVPLEYSVVDRGVAH